MDIFLSQKEIQCLVDLSIPCFSFSLTMKSLLFWGVVTALIKWVAVVVGRAYFSAIDINSCCLPEKFPVKKQRGIIDNWNRRVVDLDNSSLDSFLTFRNVEFTGLGKPQKQQLAAREALAYRNELFEENYLFYFEEKFYYKRKTPFPIMMSSWNSKGFFGEMGSGVQLIWSGLFAYSFHHLVGGLVSLYCLLVDVTYTRWICYIDIGFNLVELVLMGVSMMLKCDYTLYSGPRRMDRSKGDYTMAGFYRVLVLHHVGAISMETLALVGQTDPVLIAEGGLAMMGTTGMLYFISSLTDFMPIRESTRARFLFTAFVAAVVMYERGLLWVTKFIPGLLLDTYAKSGFEATAIAAVGLAMFTQINLEFIQMFNGKTRKTYDLWLAELEEKKSV